MKLAAVLLCVTPRIGHVDSFLAYLPVSSHAAPFFSLARKPASSSCLVRPVCRSSEIDTTQDGTADGTGQQQQRRLDHVQKALPLSPSTSTSTLHSRAAVRDQKDAGSKDDRELTLG